MGMKHFSSDCNYTNLTSTAPNPNKYNFLFKEIKRVDEVNVSIIKATYPDCNEAGREKLIVIHNDWFETKMNELDPHLSINKYIMARFQNSYTGLNLAIAFCESLKNLNMTIEIN